MKATSVLGNMFKEAISDKMGDVGGVGDVSLGDVGGMAGMENKPENPNLNIADAIGGGDDDIYIKDSAGLKSGKYSRKNIQGLAKAGKALGFTPRQQAYLVALSLQETGLGKQTGRRGGLASAFDMDDNQFKELADLSNKYQDIDVKYLKPAIILRDKLKYAKQLGFNDEASQLQAYNGYGTIRQDSFAGGAKKAYGVPIGSGIDLKKNPLYGKRLLQLTNDLVANKDFNSLIKGL